jgi:nitrite reductase/ring-hydroxylating ferredoxin subunit
MSVIVVKTKDGSIKAFHNMCRHRGNKLVWNDYPHDVPEISRIDTGRLRNRSEDRGRHRCACDPPRPQR